MTNRIKFNEWSQGVLTPGSADLKTRALTTGPHCIGNVYKASRWNFTSFQLLLFQLVVSLKGDTGTDHENGIGEMRCPFQLRFKSHFFTC